jgi:hypothetical protein
VVAVFAHTFVTIDRLAKVFWIIHFFKACPDLFATLRCDTVVRKIGCSQWITPVFRVADSDTIVNSCAVVKTFSITADAVVANFEIA